jgi:uncharacterized protein (TIGR02246 family)
MNQISRKAFLSGALLVLALSPLSSTAGAPEGQAQDEAALRELVARQAEGWNRSDAAAWSRDFAPDADFVNIVGMVFSGRAEIEKRHAFVLANVFKGSRTRVTVRKLSFPRPGLALLETEHEVTQFSMLPPGIQPTEPGVLRTRMKYVLTREQAGWQIIAGQNTAVNPAAARPEPGLKAPGTPAPGAPSPAPPR